MLFLYAGSHKMVTDLFIKDFTASCICFVLLSDGCSLGLCLRECVGRLGGC